MRSIIRALSASLAAMLFILALDGPVRADDPSGSYRIVTSTGKHMILTMVRNGDTISGIYTGNGEAGRITGKATGDLAYTYTWEERDGDSENDGTKSGWGNMTLNSDYSLLKTASGLTGESQASSHWDGSLITP